MAGAATWGLLGPETIYSERRTRGLGLGASVRLFNDLAVPDIGNVWFGKQLYLALLGVAVAKQAHSRGAKVSNIQVANAIEAIACMLAFDSNGWESDSRLRGNSKLRNKEKFDFRTVSKNGFYVTQPMRMSSVQALPELGMVEQGVSRFNEFTCTDAGIQFIDAACQNFRPYNRGVIEQLVKWVCGEENRIQTAPLRAALSPLEPLPKKARHILREYLIQYNETAGNSSSRRQNALKWVESLRYKRNLQLNWTTRPEHLSEDHWKDLRAGARFFTTRNKALTLLDKLEHYIGNRSGVQSFSISSKIPGELEKSLNELKQAAQSYLDENHADENGRRFCEECVSNDTKAVLRNLVQRDGRVLRLIGDEIKPGAAYRGAAQTGQDNEDEADPSGPASQNGIEWPEGISFRVNNLLLLNIDLHGDLNEWLNGNPESGEAQ